MRFTSIILDLEIYLSKPDIHKKTLKEVVLIFFNAMSNQEKEIFLNRCKNFNFELFKSIDLDEIQISLNKFIEQYKECKKIQL